MMPVESLDAVRYFSSDDRHPITNTAMTIKTNHYLSITRPTLSAGRMPIAEMLPPLTPARYMLDATACVSFVREPDEDDLFNMEVLDAVSAAVVESTRLILAGRVRTYVRPIGGGVPLPLGADKWELDDPAWRFASGQLNLVEWWSTDAEATHRVLVNSTDLENLKAHGEFGETAPSLALSGMTSRMPAVGGRPPANSPDQRLGEHERLVKLPEVLARTGLSRSGIYAAIKADEFPEQVRRGARGVAWRESSVEQWISSRPGTNHRD
jgi:prophage regulatory protein